MLVQNHNANESIQPNSREIEKLKAAFPQYFSKEGDFLKDRFEEMLKQEGVSLQKEGLKVSFRERLKQDDILHLIQDILEA